MSIITPMPISRAFNACILTMANRLFPAGYDVSDKAPDTLESLTDHINSTGRMLVWNGASGATIFADPEVNWAFRAWHDFHHWKGQFAFDREGELKCLTAQQADVLKVYGPGPLSDLFCHLLECEIAGQLDHEETYGEFPADQVEFTRQWFAGRGLQLAA